MLRVQQDLSISSPDGDAPGRHLDLRMLRQLVPSGRSPHICIVGAGIAGLRCANILTRRGAKVTILEARDRIGGRVHQSNHLGHIADLGANWIHGTDHNPILHLAKETATSTFHPNNDSKSVYDEHGNLLDEKKASNHGDAVWGIIGAAFKYSHEESASIPQGLSLMDYFRSSLQEKKLGDESSNLVLQMARIWGDYVGDPIEKQSLKYLWLEECIDGENLFVASTYKVILNHIAGSVFPKAQLRLSTRVIEISTNTKVDSDHTSIVAVSINTEDAQAFYDEIVVTVPLGYLKRNLNTFSPPLPDHLTKAISHITYGRLEKVYINFPVAYWHDDSSNVENTSFFTQFLHPTYAAEQNPDAWTIEAASLALLPGESAHPTLLFYMHGPCAEHITSLINGLDPESSEYFNRLQRFFEPYYSRLRNYDASSADCIPKAILATNWQNDEFAGYGSYTNCQVSHGEEQILLDKDIETLRHGAPERHLWFAGEHTAPFVALGTVTGAYWSGEAVAKRILHAYGMSDDAETETKVGAEGSSQGQDGEVKGTGHGAGVIGL